MAMIKYSMTIIVLLLTSGCAITGIYPEGAEYSYAIRLPEGDGPHPTVLFMPACDGGPVSRNVLETNYARPLRQNGFATVMFDPVTRRGIRDGHNEICKNMGTAWAHYHMRVRDIKHFLENEVHNIEYIDVNRIGLFGQSGGGIASFHFAHQQIRTIENLPNSLKAIIAEQSACHTYASRSPIYWDTPLLLIAPTRDELNPYRACIWISDKSEVVETLLLENASHAYDWPYPSRVVHVVGRSVNMWPSPRAVAATRAATVEFFKKHL